MVELNPLRALVVTSRHAAAVVGPAYDALLPEQRRRLAADNPDSFFNVVRSPADHPLVGADALLEQNAAALARMMDSGRYEAQPEGLFLYRLSTPGHRQTAVVGDLSLHHVDDGRVRAHEHTRLSKEAELARYLERLRHHSSPVGLGYRARPDIDALVDRLTEDEPQLDFTTVDGVRQQIWTIADRDSVRGLCAAFAPVDATYIIDGHHRVAAAARVDIEGHFLAALIPDRELRLLPYHRVVEGPLAADLGDRLAALEPGFDVSRASGPTVPTDPSHFVLTFHDAWYLLTRRRPLGDRLAAAVADDELLGPLFSIADARHDPRLSYVAGNVEPAAVAAVAAERDGAALLLRAPTLEQVFTEADAGRTLPPKSTWFEPKLRSGIFVVWR